MRLFVALFFCSVMMQSGAVSAQGVYETRGENGPVFSDKPQPGAKKLTLPPLTVISPVRESKGATTSETPASTPTQNDETKPEAAALAYRKFAVVFPENNGSVVANTAVFEVRVAIEPPLQLGDGHAFSISINGRPVGQRFTATEFMIPPEFWGDTLPPANQSMQLDASIIDANGQVLKKAAPIRFFLRYASIINNHRRPAAPPPNHPPLSPRKPIPRPESNGGAMLILPDK